MAQSQRDDGKPAGSSGNGKPSRNSPYPEWVRYSDYPKSRLVVYPVKPGEKAHYIYIAKDARGIVKVGVCMGLAGRFCSLTNMVGAESKPLEFVRAFQLERSIAYRAEAIAHNLLKPKLSETFFVHNEWYDTAVSYASRVVRRAIKEALA